MQRRGSNRGRALRSEDLTPSVIDLFWSKVKKTPDCWLWEGAQFSLGYGSAYIGPKPLTAHYAHRVSYALAKGSVPAGSVVMHTCDVPLCVNPDHLRLGTQGENNGDRNRKGRDAKERPSIRKISPADVRYIRASGEPSRLLAHRFGVCQSHINSIRNGRKRKVS